MITILGILLAIAIVGLVILLVFYIRYKEGVSGKLKAQAVNDRKVFDEEKGSALGERDKAWGGISKAMVEDALRGQRSKLVGEAVQKFVTWMEEFQSHYDPSDVIPINNTIDYLVLVGRRIGRITEVVIAEVKSGNSALSEVQKQVMKAERGGKVREELWHLDENSGKLLIGESGLVEEVVKEEGKAKKKKREKIFKQIAKAQKEGKEITYVVQTEGQKEW